MAEETTGKSAVSLIAGLSSQDVKLKPQISLFLTLIEQHYQRTIRLNEMTGKAEFQDELTGQWHEWTDARDAQMRAYFQEQYGIYNPKMLEDALNLYLMAHSVNPVVERLKSLKWDGKPRVMQFLHDVMKCDDNEYTRECSRLIFAGGVHRAFAPGCKFDSMVVLIGEQGCGKSTICHLLSMDESYFREIKTIANKEGVESVRGCWIGEVCELMAMTRAKEIEAVKAYITTQSDSYRPPYARHVVTVPRRCVFIGTTNNPQFLTDKTGNRRFFPVDCSASNAEKLIANKVAVSEYIEQAWAEAVQMYNDGNLQPYPRFDLSAEIKAAQDAATEDDWRIGQIEQYLHDMKSKPNSTVSVIELWHCALGEPDESKPTKKDSNEIAAIMNNMDGWVRGKNKISTKWGRQKYFIKADPFFPR